MMSFVPALSDEDQQEIRAELARRKRLLTQAAVVLVAAAVPLAVALPPWCLVVYAVSYGLWMLLMVRRHRQVVASCRANGFEG